MKIWIVEQSVIRTGADEFEEAVRTSGAGVRWLSIDDEARGRYGRWDENDTVVFRGSFEAAETFRISRPDARPGVIGDQNLLKCSAYYPTVGPYLLNEEYVLIPLGDLRRLWPSLLQMFQAKALFVRPDSGAKAFTGQLINDLDRFWSRERPYLESMAPSALCVVARPREIEAEYRTVAVGGEIVAASLYKANGQREISRDVGDNVLNFAKAVLKDIPPPAPAFMLDIAVEADGRLSAIELNAFSCSDFYACDPAPIVEAIARL